jgi:mono/diheme cytochrome c family protein
MRLRTVICLIGVFAPLGAARGQAGGRTPPNPPRTGAATGRLDPVVIMQLWQPRKLPPLPMGMTIRMLVQGDSIFHGAGGCAGCHGMDGEGMPNAGASITAGVHFVQAIWPQLDSLVTAGVSEAFARPSIGMPARGAASNLTPQQIRMVSAYVWAISTTFGEPWPGGHATHRAAPAAAAAASPKR